MADILHFFDDAYNLSSTCASHQHSSQYNHKEPKIKTIKHTYITLR